MPSRDCPRDVRARCRIPALLFNLFGTALVDWSYARVSHFSCNWRQVQFPRQQRAASGQVTHMLLLTKRRRVSIREPLGRSWAASLEYCLNDGSGDVEILSLLTLIWVGFSAAACFASLLWWGFL